MPDNREKRHGQDSAEINVLEPWECRHWTQRLGVSLDQFRAAVAAAGPRASAVQEHLAANAARNASASPAPAAPSTASNPFQAALPPSAPAAPKTPVRPAAKPAAPGWASKPSRGRR
jgi:Protein of unknown function (DUF3606)